MSTNINNVAFSVMSHLLALVERKHVRYEICGLFHDHYVRPIARVEGLGAEMRQFLENVVIPVYPVDFDSLSVRGLCLTTNERLVHVMMRAVFLQQLAAIEVSDAQNGTTRVSDEPWAHAVVANLRTVDDLSIATKRGQYQRGRVNDMPVAQWLVWRTMQHMSALTMTGLGKESDWLVPNMHPNGYGAMPGAGMAFSGPLSGMNPFAGAPHQQMYNQPPNYSQPYGKSFEQPMTMSGGIGTRHFLEQVDTLVQMLNSPAGALLKYDGGLSLLQEQTPYDSFNTTFNLLLTEIQTVLATDGTANSAEVGRVIPLKDNLGFVWVPNPPGADVVRLCLIPEGVPRQHPDRSAGENECASMQGLGHGMQLPPLTGPCNMYGLPPEVKAMVTELVALLDSPEAADLAFDSGSAVLKVQAIPTTISERFNELLMGLLDTLNHAEYHYEVGSQVTLEGRLSFAWQYVGNSGVKVPVLSYDPKRPVANSMLALNKLFKRSRSMASELKPSPYALEALLELLGDPRFAELAVAGDGHLIMQVGPDSSYKEHFNEALLQATRYMMCDPNKDGAPTGKKLETGSDLVYMWVGEGLAREVLFYYDRASRRVPCAAPFADLQALLLSPRVGELAYGDNGHLLHQQTPGDNLFKEQFNEALRQARCFCINNPKQFPAPPGVMTTLDRGLLYQWTVEEGVRTVYLFDYRKQNAQ